MTEALLGIAIMVLLFVIAGVFRHRGCTGHCAGCTGACGRYEEGNHDDH